jgi:hypothetical protein
MRRIIGMFEGGPFHPEAVSAVWRGLINGSLAMEGELKISVMANEQHPELYWLAREHFGSVATYMKETTVKRVIGNIIDGKASIGIVPVLRTDEVTPWWPDLTQHTDDWPKIFARIPFVEPARPARDAASGIAIGKVAPEATGDDLSFIAIEAEENTSMHKLQSAFSQAGLQAQWVDVLTHTSGRRHHLIELKGFITPDHDAYQRFAISLGGSLLNSVFIGAYATPITLALRRP